MAWLEDLLVAASQARRNPDAARIRALKDAIHWARQWGAGGLDENLCRHGELYIAAQARGDDLDAAGDSLREATDLCCQDDFGDDFGDEPGAAELDFT